MNVLPGGDETTILGDLCTPDCLPENTFDCIIATQILQYMFDIRVAVANLARALKPGGVLLVTLPGISPIERAEWEWYWSFNEISARKLFTGHFDPQEQEIVTCGNSFASTCFIQGVAFEEVGEQWLSPVDPGFPVCVTVKAVKARS